MSDIDTVVTEPPSNMMIIDDDNVKDEEGNISEDMVKKIVQDHQIKVRSNAIPTEVVVADAGVISPLPLEEFKKEKETKKRNASHVKTESQGGNNGNGVGNAPKRPRVTPERAQAVADKIVQGLVTHHGMGNTKIQMDILALDVGYKNPRSDAIMAATKILKQRNIAVKFTENATQYVGLTTKGVEEFVVPREEPPTNNETAFEKSWSLLAKKLAATPETAGDKVRDAAISVWDALKTGETYTKQQLVDVTHYGRDSSTSCPEILSSLLDLGMTETIDDNSFRFTDKMFPFGRPEYLYDDQKVSFPLINYAIGGK